MSVENARDTAAASCPGCGASRPEGLSECMTCGIIFAKVRPQAELAEAKASPLSTSDLYSAPTASLVPDQSAEIWRQKKVLIVSREAELPDRCVRCNAPSDRRLAAKLSWHAGGWYLFVLVNLFIYFLVSLCVSKRAKLEVPLCREHHEKRRSRLLAAWGLVLGGLVLAFSWALPPFQNVSEEVGLSMILGGGLFLVVGIVAASNLSQLVAPKRIEKEFVWLRKCSEEYLASFPEAPAGFSR